MVMISEEDIQCLMYLQYAYLFMHLYLFRYIHESNRGKITQHPQLYSGKMYVIDRHAERVNVKQSRQTYEQTGRRKTIGK